MNRNGLNFIAFGIGFLLSGILCTSGNVQNAEALVEGHEATTGLYDISDSLRGPLAQDANAFAILFGVAPGSQWNSILRNLKEALNTTNGPLAFAPASGFTVIISPFSSSFEAWARFEAGDATGALSLIRTVWGHMQRGQPFFAAEPGGLRSLAAAANAKYSWGFN